MSVYIACHNPIFGGAVIFFSWQFGPVIVDIRAVNLGRISWVYDIEHKVVTYSTTCGCGLHDSIIMNK